MILDDSNIQFASKLLRAGELVAFPTETVYGLGADAKNESAIKKIFEIKKRPIDHPVIVHLPSLEQLSDWVSSASPIAEKLATHFWPGPLTLILPKASHVSNLLTGGQNTIGLRVPSHPVAQALLQNFGSGIAAPSANRFGKISPTCGEHVREELGDRVAMILEGGTCLVGIESTIVDLSSTQPVILRPGAIMPHQISEVIGMPITVLAKSTLRASGTLETHYAPNTPLVLCNTETIKMLLLENQNTNFIALIYSNLAEASTSGTKVFKMPTRPSDYAQKLYSILRDLDHQNFDQILVERVPETEEWLAIADRLQRASQK